MKQCVALQRDYDCFYCVVDLHALTVPQDPKTFARTTLETAIDMLAVGIDPERSALFIQSQIPQHAELAWMFNTITPLGELERMTQFKEKKQRHGIVMGLLDYPVLMAVDILIYKPAVVPIGDDQVQHLELTHSIARKFNRLYGETFPEPRQLLTKTARVMSLTDPKKKMSKSDGVKSYIGLSDEPNIIKQKLAKAVTATTGGKENPGVVNLLSIMAEVSDAETVKEFEAAEKKGTIRYAEFKERLANDLSEHFAPFRKKRAELLKKPKYVREVLEEGRKKASAIAKKTMDEVRGKMGLLQ